MVSNISYHKPDLRRRILAFSTSRQKKVKIYIVLLPPAIKLGQGFVFTGVCDSVHRGGCLPQCMVGYHTPPGADTPQKQTPPREQTPPRADTPPWSRHPPPATEHAGRYGQRVGGTHPTGMQSSFVLILATLINVNVTFLSRCVVS